MLNRDPQPPGPGPGRSAWADRERRWQSKLLNKNELAGLARALTAPTALPALPDPFGSLDSPQFQQQRSTISDVDNAMLDAVEIGERPAKRARFDDNLVTSPSHIYTSDEAAFDTRQPLPFPPQPTRPRHAKVALPTPAELAARRADGLNPPAIAVKLPGDTVADFCPWRGDSNEDVINEQVVKAGYCDKGGTPSQTETNSARVTIWPVLTMKNNVGLHTLSAILTQVLERRQQAGRVTAPSSFKPPPRVTVTDTKREAWLRDLANPSISLKRQSRTIPHGIRGRVLLDQCLQKSIPLQRAVWLAKCVGANELRAFRKKGVSGAAAAQGEAKWIREWTMCVTQHTGEIFKSEPKEGWKAQVEYTVKLVAILFSEGLLEQDYFLDWLISVLSNIDLDHLPLWLLPVRVFWKHLTMIEQRGRKLSLIVLRHLEAVVEGGHAVYEPIRLQLQKMVCSLALQAPACLVIPTVWSQHAQNILDSIKLAPKEFREATTRTLRARNVQLQASDDGSENAEQKLFRLLDSASLDIDLTKMVLQCQQLIPNAHSLVSCLLTWATSVFRTGFWRILLASALLKDLTQTGHNSTVSILSFLSASISKDRLDQTKLVALVRHLAIKDCFPAGHFMQWLITAGAPSPDSARLSLRLLAALPDEHLSQSLRNTRASLLNRANYGMSDHTVQITAALDVLLTQGSPQMDGSTVSLLQQSTSTGIVSKWVLHRAALMFKDKATTTAAFSLFRHALEALHDIDSLHRLLVLATEGNDFKIVGLTADVVNTHAQEFAIKGALKSLTQALVERYRTLRKQQSLERSSIYALRNLIKRQNGDLATIKFFNSDIAIYEQQNLNIVCSPASDSLIGMHAGSLDSDEEIEAVFASGNTMDEHLMHRVLDRVLQRATVHSAKISAEQSSTCKWLIQLRMLDRVTFDKIAGESVPRMLANGNSGVAEGISALIAADCFGFEALLAAGRLLPPAVASRAMTILAGSVEIPALAVHERYHLDQQRAAYRCEHPDVVAELLQSSLRVPYNGAVPQCMISAAAELHSAGYGNLHKIAESARGDSIASTNLLAITTAMLANDPASQTMTPIEVMAAATALNVELCTTWLMCTGTPTIEDEAQVKNSVMQAIASKSPVWRDLLRASPASHVASVHDWAIKQLVNSESTSADALKHACRILDVTSSLVKADEQAAALSLLAMRLRAIGKSLTPTESTPTPASSPVAAQLLPLLRAVLLTSQSMPKAEASLQARMQTVLGLCALLAQVKLHEYASLMQYMHDIASQIIDKLPSEALLRLLKGLSNAGLRHESYKSILGTSPDSSAWLALATTIKQPNLRLPTASQAAAGAPRSKMPIRPGAQSGDPVIKYAPYVPQSWEMMRDAAPNVGENDGSISLALFGARKM